MRRGACILPLLLRGAVGIPIGGTVGELLPSELPGPTFPGPTPTISNGAWPLTHRQPGRFDAWPQLGYGTLNRTLLPCWKRTVLHDHANGWPGLCTKLMLARKHTTQERCRALCWSEPRCAVWQFVNQSSPGQCWVGYGEDCAWRDGHAGAIHVQAAQRIMHGAVRVLKDLSGWKIQGLYKLGMYHAGDERLSILRCKAWCYSDIACQYWQYGPGGCWVDAPRSSIAENGDVSQRVQQPLTTNGGASNTSDEALAMMWGEYIQHYCPPQYTTPPPVLRLQSQPSLRPHPPSPAQVAPQRNSSPSRISLSAWWLCGGVALCGAGACAAASLWKPSVRSQSFHSRTSSMGSSAADFGDDERILQSSLQTQHYGEEEPPPPPPPWPGRRVPDYQPLPQQPRYEPLPRKV